MMETTKGKEGVEAQGLLSPGIVAISLEDNNNASASSSNGQDKSSNLLAESTPSDLGEDEHGIRFEDRGFKVDRLFEVAYRFYKRNENKAFHPSFDLRNQMNALVLQAKFGNFNENKGPDIGVLDLVGKSRRHQWSLLSGMSKTEAMVKFICTLDEICPLFKAYAEAVKISSDSHEGRGGGEFGRLTNGRTNSAGQSGQRNELESREQLNAIRTSLGKQSYNQFKGYAEKQFPNDLVQQKYLIASLQEQYFQQYISQMHPELSVTSSDSTSSNISLGSPEAGQHSSLSPAPSRELANRQVDSPTERELVGVNKQAGELGGDPESSVKLEQTGGQRADLATVMQDQQSDARTSPTTLAAGAGVSGRDGNTHQASASHLIQQASHHSTSGQLNPTVIERASGQTKAENSSREVIRVNSHSDKSSSAQLAKNNNNENKLAEQVARTYESLQPQQIGKFESFPEPKPIQASHVVTQLAAQRAPSLSINLLNQSSRLSSNPTASAGPSSNILAPVSTHGQQQPFAHLQYPPTQTQPPILHPQQRLSEQTQVYHPQQQQPQQQHYQQQPFDYPNQSGPATPSGQPACEPSGQISQLDRISPTSCSLANQPELLGGAEHAERQVDTWGYASSSSGSASPMRASLSYDPLEPASIWTKKGVSAFKDSLMDDKHASAYLVKQGTLLTVQVPTYPDGRYIQFEFVTDDFDIGFGLDFVYEPRLAQPLSIVVYEESDEDDVEEAEELDELALADQDYLEAVGEGDVELPANGTGKRQLLERRRAEKLAKIASTVPIVPTYRRDSHEEIFVGRHKYPAQGYYRLKFDNTYSVLRTKNLYLRICYMM